MNFSGLRVQFEALSQTYVSGTLIPTPAVVLKMILKVGALYIIFKTCRVASQLYPEESGKRLEDIKNYKNGIQLLCANSDHLDTIVWWVWLGASLEISNSIRSKIFNTTSPQPPTPTGRLCLIHGGPSCGRSEATTSSSCHLFNVPGGLA